MANLPKTVEIDLQDFLFLSRCFQLCAEHPQVGEFGTVPLKDTLSRIAQRSKILVTPTELESFVYHMKVCLMEPKIQWYRKPRSYHWVMKRLKEDIPTLFKEQSNGEITFIDFKDQAEGDLFHDIDSH